VFRTPPEKWHNNCILPRKSQKDKSLMFWSCFWGKNRGPHVPLPQRSITDLVYCCILHKYLLPIIFKINSTIGDPVFQQDHAKIHTAGITIRFFEWYNIQIANHPPYSTDFNIIEHAWVLLKKQLLVDYPNIGDTPGGPDEVKAKLAEVLLKVWEKIPEHHFEKLWKSMPNRVQAVIEAKGWYTKSLTQMLNKDSVKWRFD
ncbi:hypothetical protein K440DRAFT_572032, partial [Wilcoxina mikolae CBS 423.85]